jgi:hypothetical protein
VGAVYIVYQSLCLLLLHLFFIDHNIHGGFQTQSSLSVDSAPHAGVPEPFIALCECNLELIKPGALSRVGEFSSQLAAARDSPQLDFTPQKPAAAIPVHFIIPKAHRIAPYAISRHPPLQGFSQQLEVSGKSSETPCTVSPRL